MEFERNWGVRCLVLLWSVACPKEDNLFYGEKFGVPKSHGKWLSVDSKLGEDFDE